MAVFASAADALSCAITVQQGLARERRRDDAPFVARIGVSAGDVSEEDGDFHGTPVVEAALVQRRARRSDPRGRCRAGTGRQSGGHEFVPMGGLDLKGLTEPLVAWEVVWSLGEARVEMPARLSEVAARGACVGRDDELELVVTAWKRVTTGERRMVMVAGEPGIGKTRLAAELAARVVDHGGIVLHGWCDEDLGSPYQPWAQSLSAYVRTAAADDVEMNTAGISADLSRLVPELAARLSETVPTTATDAESERARLFDAVDIFVERVSAQQPVLFVLDDVHWADRPTWRCCVACSSRIVRDRCSSSRHIVTLISTGDTRWAKYSPTFGGRHASSDFRSAGSARAASARCSPIVPATTLRPSLFASCWTSRGKPVLRGGGRGAPGRDGCDLPARRHVDERSRSRGLGSSGGSARRRRSSAVTTVADGQRPAHRRGRRRPRIRPRVKTIAAGGFERDASLDAVDASIATGLVTEVPGAPGRYSFSHALVRQTLLEEISGARRARLHWRVGEALAAGRIASASTIAFHLCEGVLAGDVARVAEAAVAAAEVAVSIGAPDEGRSLALRAMSVLTDANADEPELRCRALLVVGETASALQQDFEAARARVVEAAGIAQDHGWPELATRAAIACFFLSNPARSTRSRRNWHSTCSSSEPTSLIVRCCRQRSACIRCGQETGKMVQR